MKQQKSNPGVIAGLALIFVLLLAANFLTPMTADGAGNLTLRCWGRYA